MKVNRHNHLYSVLNFMLPKTIQYKRNIIKIRYIGRKESQDLNCVGMFIPADYEILIYKDQSSDIYIVTASWNFILNEWAVVNKVGLICNEMIYNRGKIMVSRDFDCD